jgi:serine protease Do
MRRPKGKYPFYLTVLAFILSIIFTLSAEVRAAASGAPSPNQVLEPASAERVSSYFSAAREDFLKGALKDSALQVRKASELLGAVQIKSAGTAWESLSTARAGLDILANAIEQKRVGSIDELDRIFAVAERALAGYYEERAAESQAARNHSEFSLYLKTAAVHLENALKGLITPLDRKTAGAIKEAREFGERLAAGWPSAEATKVREALRAAIDKADGGIKTGLEFGGSAIHVVPKPSGTLDLETVIIDVARRNLPSVVYIEVTESKVVENPLLPFQNDPFFKKFFGIPKMPRKFRQEIKGLGSGVIVDADGHILTNNHVAGAATKLEVALADGSHHPARLVGADPKTDLAVIKISVPEPLPHLVFGDSDKIQVGEWVVAVGAPRAFEKTVTKGIVSAKHRTGITDPTGIEDFLQTDAAMNPGNSGGPLLNLYGQVIGINTAIASSSGGSEGIGFTIPSNMAVYVARALIAHGKVVRGWLGVAIRDVTPEIAKAAHLEALKGAVVAAVVSGGPADRAGLRKDDVITAYNGKEVPDSGSLRNDVAETSPGRAGRITILRGGKREELTVTIGSEEEAAKLTAASVRERLGIEVRSPTSDETDRYNLPAGSGAFVTMVDPKGPMGASGIETEDIILAVNNQPVSGPEGLAGALSVLKQGEKVPVIVLDHRTGDGDKLEVVVK